HRSGDAAFHVRRAAPVKASVGLDAAEWRHRPAEVLADRERVEMAVEDEAPAGPAAADAGNHIDDAGRGFETLHLGPGYCLEESRGDPSRRRDVSRRVG